MAICIAIVDDDETVLDAIQLVLEEEGWHVHTYLRGEDFLADLGNHEVDCVILDPHLPGITGAHVARSLMNASSHVPIVGLTARPSSPLTIEVINAGARVMLTKPIAAEDLVEQVQAAITS